MQKIIDKFNSILAEYQADFAGIEDLVECMAEDTAQLEGMIANFKDSGDLNELYRDLRYLDTLVREYFYDVFPLIVAVQEEEFARKEAIGAA